MYAQSQPVPAKKPSAYDIYIQENIARREAFRGRIQGYVPKNEPIPDNHFAHPLPQHIEVQATDKPVAPEPDTTLEPVRKTGKYDTSEFAFRSLYKQHQSITDSLKINSIGVNIRGCPKSGMSVFYTSATAYNCRAGPPG